MSLSFLIVERLRPNVARFHTRSPQLVGERLRVLLLPAKA
jgi:hypothetical protein